MIKPVLRSFLSKGIISVIDQAIFSGSSFVISILLGRWLSLEAYGAYSVANVVFLLSSGQYGAFILEPMSVLGPGVFQKSSKGYVRFIRNTHFIVTLFLLLLSLVATVFLRGLVSSSVRVMAICLPLMLSFWLARWFLYMQMKPSASLTITVFYVILLFGGVFLVKNFFTISVENIFIIMGLASLIPSLFIYFIYMGEKGPSDKERVRFRDLLKDHWSYGKWIAVASVLNWGAVQIFTVFTAGFLDLASVGGLKAMQNFSQPLEQVSTALGLLLIPYTSRLYAEGNYKMLKKITSSINYLIFGIGAVYLLIFWLFKEPILNLVYQGKYNDFAWLTPMVICVPIIYSLSRGAQIGVRAIREPKNVLYAYALSAVVSLTIGPVLVLRFHLTGAVAGMWLSAICFSVLINILYASKSKGITQDVEVPI